MLHLLSLSLLVLSSSAAPRHFDPALVQSQADRRLSERELIARHLEIVETTLRRETPEGLTPTQQRARAALLDELHAYRERGEFPRNLDFGDRRVPYFIDDRGTACAVGQLMIASGADDLAREIATYENNDFLADIDHPDVAAWLAANGLTAAEAAWIQPSYSRCWDEPYVCGVDGQTYECYDAAECAGVEVEYEGACGFETETDGNVGNPDVEVEDVCDDDKGCTVATPPGPIPALFGVGLIVLGAAYARRRS